MVTSSISSTSERRQTCIAMYRRGFTYRQIAAELGIHRSTVWNYVNRSLVKRNKSKHKEEYVEHDWAITDQLLHVYMPRALAGDLPASVHALKILERRAKLRGLDAPVQIDQRHSGSIDTGKALTRAEMRSQIMERLQEIERLPNRTSPPAVDQQSERQEQLTQQQAQHRPAGNVSEAVPGEITLEGLEI